MNGRRGTHGLGRRGTRRVVAAALLSLLAIGAGAGAARADSGSDQTDKKPPRSQGADETQFLNLANSARASQDSQDLSVDPDLTSIARYWAARMAGASDIFHNYDLPQEVHKDWYKLGENVGMGWSVSDLHNAFVKSPSHYHNLVDPTYAYVGIGVAYNSDGKIFVAFDFMDMQPSAPAPAGATPPPVAQVSAAQGLVLVRSSAPAVAPMAAPIAAPRASVPVANVEPVVNAVHAQEAVFVSLPPPRAKALTSVLSELRSMDVHAPPPRPSARAAPRPAPRPARRAEPAPTTTTTTVAKKKPPAPKPPAPARAEKPAKPQPPPTTPADAARAWLTPTYCDPKPRGSC